MVHRRPVYIYLFNVPSFSSRHFNKIKRTSRLGRLLALSLEILLGIHSILELRSLDNKASFLNCHRKVIYAVFSESKCVVVNQYYTIRLLHQPFFYQDQDRHYGLCLWDASWLLLNANKIDACDKGI